MSSACHKNKISIIKFFPASFLLIVLLFALSFLLFPTKKVLAAGNTTGFAWSSEAGWIDFAPALGGVTVSDAKLTGYAWGAEAGWLNFDCAATPGECPNNSQQKVTNNGDGNLSGFAWGAEIGWLNFNCQVQGGCLPGSTQKVEIDGANGNFSGYAWSDEIGWVSFEAADGANVNTSWRSPSPPDLIVVAPLSAPAGVLISGNTLTFNATVKNQGGSASGANSITRFKIDTDNNGSYDVILTDQTTGNLVANGTETESATWTAVAGTHKYQVCADNGLAIAESNEGNNCAVSSTFTVVAASDFSLSAAPSAITALPTDSKTSVITVVPSGGFNSKVTLSIQSISSNPGNCISYNFTPDSKPQPPGDAIRSLNFTISNCPVGLNSDIIVAGKQGPDTRTTTINLTVQVNKTGNTYGYAWGENIGWLRFSCKDKSAGGIGGQPQTGDKCAINGGADYGVLTGDTALYGYAWGENIGWLSMNCNQTLVGGGNTCGTVSYGVSNDGIGKLAGYAWSENIGWLSFKDTVNPTPLYQVKINETGVFSGYAWSETAGYISFNSGPKPPAPQEYYVQTEWLGADTPPQAPWDPQPQNNTNNISVYLEQLKWKSGDADGDNLVFYIYLDPFDSPSTDLTGGVGLNSNGALPNTIFRWPDPAPGWPGFNLEPNTNYYWQVEIWDPLHGLIVPSVIWKFKTVKDDPYIRTSEDADYELNFGTVKIGTTKTMYVVVCNFPVKDDKLKTSNISLTNGANGFSLGDDIYYVKADGTTDIKTRPAPTVDLDGIQIDGPVVGECASSVIDKPSYNIVVNFSPSTAVALSDILTIASNDPDAPNYQITLNGSGQAPPATITPTTPSGGVKIRR